MGKLNVKNGTPTGTTHLCMSCTWGQFITGYRESDRLAICNNTHPNLVLPFTVYECSSFEDKHRPDYRQMEKLAINIQPVRISSRTAGFSTSNPPKPVTVSDGDEDEGEDEVAPVR